MRPSIAARVMKHNADNADREQRLNRQIRMALDARKMRHENIEAVKVLQFDLHLAGLGILKRAEELRDMNEPKTLDEEWNDEFCMAVGLIPEARMFAEDMAMECTEVKKNG